MCKYLLNSFIHLVFLHTSLNAEGELHQEEPYKFYLAMKDLKILIHSPVTLLLGGIFLVSRGWVMMIICSIFRGCIPPHPLPPHPLTEI